MSELHFLGDLITEKNFMETVRLLHSKDAYTHATSPSEQSRGICNVLLALRFSQRSCCWPVSPSQTPPQCCQEDHIVGGTASRI